MVTKALKEQIEYNRAERLAFLERNNAYLVAILHNVAKVIVDDGFKARNTANPWRLLESICLGGM